MLPVDGDKIGFGLRVVRRSFFPMYTSFCPELSVAGLKWVLGTRKRTLGLLVVSLFINYLFTLVSLTY